MPMPQNLAGRRFGPLRWQASPRRVLAYRAAMAPHNTVGLDDTRAPLHALPTHAATPEWLLTLKILASIGSEMPYEEALRGVHISQDTTFFAPITAGDEIEVEAEIIGARPTQRGALLSVRFETRHVDKGVLLASSVSATLYRDVAGAASGEIPPRPQIHCLESADAIAAVDFPRGFVHVYSECAEIWNPIHTERRVAHAAGLDDIIVHGSALWAAAGLTLISANGGDAAHLRRLTARFLAPATAGAPLSLLARSGVVTPYSLVTADGTIAAAGEAVFGAP